MLIVLSMKLACGSGPRGWNSQAQKWEDLAKWRIRNEKLFRKIVQGIAKKLMDYEEFAVQKLKELDNWSMMNSLRKIKRILPQWTSLRFRFWNCKTKWIPWAMQKKSMILKLRTALDYPTFPVNPWVFRVPEEWLAAILACTDTRNSLGTSGHVFWRSTCSRRTTKNLASSSCRSEPLGTRNIA